MYTASTYSARLSATTTFGDEELDREGRQLATVGRGQEYLSRADSLLAGANAAGRFTEDVRAELVRVISTARFLLTDRVSDLPEPDRTAYQRLAADTAFRDLTRLQDALVAHSRTDAPPPVPSTSWQPAYDTSAQQLRAALGQVMYAAEPEQRARVRELLDQTRKQIYAILAEEG